MWPKISGSCWSTWVLLCSPSGDTRTLLNPGQPQREEHWQAQLCTARPWLLPCPPSLPWEFLGQADEKAAGWLLPGVPTWNGPTFPGKPPLCSQQGWEHRHSSAVLKHHHPYTEAQKVRKPLLLCWDPELEWDATALGKTNILMDYPGARLSLWSLQQPLEQL